MGGKFPQIATVGACGGFLSGKQPVPVPRNNGRVNKAYPSNNRLRLICRVGCPWGFISLKPEINTLKTARAIGISASGEGQGCGDRTQLYHKNKGASVQA